MRRGPTMRSCEAISSGRSTGCRSPTRISLRPPGSGPPPDRRSSPTRCPTRTICSPNGAVPPVPCSSGRRTRPSSGPGRRPSTTCSGRRATPTTRRRPAGARPVAPPWPSHAAWCRSPTAATWGIPAQSRRVLQRRGVPPDARPRAVVAVVERLAGSRRRRPDGSHRRGRRAAPLGAGRARSTGADLAARTRRRLRAPLGARGSMRRSWPGHRTPEGRCRSNRGSPRSSKPAGRRSRRSDAGPSLRSPTCPMRERCSSRCERISTPLSSASLLDEHRRPMKDTVVWNIEQGIGLSQPQIARAERLRTSSSCVPSSGSSTGSTSS